MSTPNSARPALVPQRRHGKERVAALLAAAAAVIAEKGFDAATMAEVASRAGAPIGSLYRFFPSKEVLADALAQRYAELIRETFARIDAQLPQLSIAALADALLDRLVGLHSETRAMLALLEADAEASKKREAFRGAARRHIAKTLTLRCPKLPAATAANMAVVLLHSIKTMAALTVKKPGKPAPGPVAELREMTRLYLASRLGEGV